MNDQLDDLYREIILDHYKAPRGRTPVERADITSEGHNPSCGDEIMMKLRMDNGTVEDVHVDCRGCAISVASGSMLAEYIKGRSLEEVQQLAQAVRKILKGEDADLPKELEDLEALKGVRNFPVRIKCALLSWTTLLEGLSNYSAGHNESSGSTTE